MTVTGPDPSQPDATADLTGAPGPASPGGGLKFAALRYRSSIEPGAIGDLYVQCAYPAGQSDLPIVLLLHGWRGDADSFDRATIARLAGYGFFVAVPGLRGRNGAAGGRDASGREIYDIYDALTSLRAGFPGLASADKAALAGYSGGGGNALAAACKFPDAWTCVVSHFGMSDYGRDAVDGWHANNGGDYTDEIEASVGGAPAELPNRYSARDATSAIANFTGGRLFLFHDRGDDTVPWAHGERIRAAMAAAGPANTTAWFTGPGDDPRWLHGYPLDIPELVEAEAVWKAAALAQAAWTVPAAGTLACIGYLKTRRFEVRLGALDDHAATIAYDTAAGRYTVTPLTGAMTVSILQADGKTAQQTIRAQTTLTVRSGSRG